MRFKCKTCGTINKVIPAFHSKGGKARMASITAEERSRNAKKAAETRRKRKLEGS